MLLISGSCFAITVEPILEDPFDIGGGGSSLTRATQEGNIISNPAMLPYGGVFYRWFGFKSTVFAGQDSIGIAQQQLQGGESEEGEEAGGPSDEEIQQLVDQPVHIGASQTMSLLLNNGGFTAFINTHPDIRAWPKGDPYKGIGGPTVVARNEIYAGLVASLATQSLWRWLSFGFNFKYLLVNDSITSVDMTDREAVEELQAKSTEIDQSILNTGAGVDAAMMLFFQSDHVDFRVAAVAENAGGMTLVGTGDPKEKLMMVHGGVGLTFHTQQDALHFSVDYRDALKAYAQPEFKKIYAGTKILLRQYVGLSTGIYHGAPSYGCELDFILFRVAGSTYMREYGDTPGVDRRRVFVASITMGY